MSLIKQYFEETKSLIEKYGEKSIVLMQVGSFYEVYAYKNKSQNIIYGSAIEEFKSICNFHVSEKKGVKTENDNTSILMAGFPEYQVEKYVALLQEFKYTVAVYKQYKEESGHIRKLEIICSPGTYFNDGVVQRTLSNFISCIRIYRHKPTKFKLEDFIIIGISSMNIFTGECTFAEYKEQFRHSPSTYDFLVRYMSIINPTELIIIYNLNEYQEEWIDNLVLFIECSNIALHKIDLSKETSQSISALRCEKQQVQYEILLQCYPQYDIDVMIAECGFRENYIAWHAMTFLLDFIFEHNRKLLEKIQFPQKEFHNKHLHLANHSLKQLNIISDDRHAGKKSSILEFMNRCITPMGKRKFKDWLLHPLIDVEVIQKRYDIIGYMKNMESTKEIKNILTMMTDISKLLRTINMGKYTIQNIINLYNNICLIQKINQITIQEKEFKSYFPHNYSDSIYDILTYLKNTVNLEYGKISYEHICDDIECGMLYARNVFQRGKYPEVDIYERNWIENVEKIHALRDYFSNTIESLLNKRKKSTTSINTNYCKIQHMEKTGYYLKSTATRCELLKNYLNMNDSKEVFIEYYSILDDSKKKIKLQLPITISNVSTSDKRITNNQIDLLMMKCRENREVFMNAQSILFENKMKTFIDSQNDMICDITEYISTVDVILGNAELSTERNYCCPIIEQKDIAYIQATSLRHPLIEVIQTQESYVSNDFILNNKSEGILLFGTNAVGKSSLIKAIGINVILAQAGFFVPCSSFIYSPFNKIFTRILGNDNIFKGLSTFAVEMSELNTILRYSDENSLVLGDELCSGTEMGSAISIFVAGLLELEKKHAKYIFATHLHEIVDMQQIKKMTRMQLKHLSVEYCRENDELIYDRKLQDGPGNNLYGLEVCKALHLPKHFLEIANSIRTERYPREQAISKRNSSRYNRTKIKVNCELCDSVTDEVHHLQQQSHADKNGFIGTLHKDHKSNLLNVCHRCHDEIHKDSKIIRRKKTSNGLKLIEETNKMVDVVDK